MQPRDLSSNVAYVAGRGTEEVARELDVDPDSLIKLASNENPIGPSPRAVDVIRDHADRVHVYPTSAHTDLAGRLAERWNVGHDQIWLANGGDGALDYLSRAMLDPGDAVLVPNPGFAYYGMSARFHHATVDSYPIAKRDAFAMGAGTILEAFDGERIVYLTSPHNPTGSVIALDDVETIARRTGPETLVVVDEAYGEFSESPSAVSLLDERDDVAVLRTFSKAYGLAGLRLGYAIVPPSWADAYARVNTPFAASELACRAGMAALDDDEHVGRSIDLARWSRGYMIENLEAVTFPSEGNFVLVETGDASATATTLQRRGIIVRDCTSFGLPECIRITCGTEDETRRVVEAVNGIDR